MGSIPAFWPKQLAIGLQEISPNAWMHDSSVPWTFRYRYLVKGWVNNWGNSAASDGAFARRYLDECGAQGFVPTFSFYQLLGEPGGGEESSAVKLKNSAAMKTYFSDFRTLMQLCRAFGKPVLVLIEADGFALIEAQAQAGDYAAVKDSGVAELGSLPNTVAGWGQAFPALRAAVGASNVMLGMHVSTWTTGVDVMHGSGLGATLSAEVDKGFAFLSQLGLASYDLIYGDPCDRDADYHLLVNKNDRWWDASPGAALTISSFNRYAEWLRLWTVKSGKRWALWQIPCGNSNHLNVYNNGQPRQGYKDNRAEYFLGGVVGSKKFVDAGVIGLLFGAGATGQSTHVNDQFPDGQLFIKSRAGALLAAGGIPLPAEIGAPAPPPTTTPPPIPLFTPAVGRIVLYQSFGTPGGEFTSLPRAALVTEVIDANKGDIGLCVINPTGIFFGRALYSAQPKPGTWSWPVVAR